MLLCCCLAFFHFSLKDSLWLCLYCKSGADNLPQLLSVFVLKDRSATHRPLAGQLFPCSICTCHPSAFWELPVGKPTRALRVVSLYTMSHFRCFQNSLFVWLLTIRLQCIPMWTPLDISVLGSLGLLQSGYLFSSPGLGSFQPLFTQISFLHPPPPAFPGKPTMWVLVVFMLFHKSFLSSLSLFIFPSNQIFSLSSLTLSFVWSSLLLNPSSKFVISFIVFFGSRIFIRSFLKYSLCWCSHFVHALFSWAGWAPPWGFHWIISLVINVPIYWGLVCGDLFCSFDWSMFPFFFMCLVTVGICAFDKTTISLSLYRLASYREKNFISQWG